MKSKGAQQNSRPVTGDLPHRFIVQCERYKQTTLKSDVYTGVAPRTGTRDSNGSRPYCSPDK
jgi:hypothetical protein